LHSGSLGLSNSALVPGSDPFLLSVHSEGAVIGRCGQNTLQRHFKKNP